MNMIRATLCCLAASLPAARLAADEIFDRLADALTVSALQQEFRAHLSGTLDLEQYHIQLPAPGLISGTDSDLFNPRLTLFLDAQYGAKVYVFAQARLDRGFDPGYNETQVRLDEYALRLAPWPNVRMNFQIGKFATVAGSWVQRHDTWTNPFVTAPLPYENLTGVWDAEAVRSSTQLLQWSHVRPGLPAAITAIEKQLRLPIIWGPSYTIGAAMFGSVGKISYAAEVKNGALSSRPEEWNDSTAVRWAHPTVSGRVGFRPNEMWSLGWSASTGSYLRPFAMPTIPRGSGLGDYREKLLAQDVGYAWHHWQVWSEVFAARFVIPTVGNADTLAYYTEVKYKFTPQLSGAIRWNQQLFASISNHGTRATWGRDIWRLDFAPGYRFTPQTQLKLQFSLEHEADAERDYSPLIAGQFTTRF